MGETPGNESEGQTWVVAVIRSTLSALKCKAGIYFVSAVRKAPGRPKGKITIKLLVDKTPRICVEPLRNEPHDAAGVDRSPHDMRIIERIVSMRRDACNW